MAAAVERFSSKQRPSPRAPNIRFKVCILKRGEVECYEQS
jgi:hypothetical protein